MHSPESSPQNGGDMNPRLKALLEGITKREGYKRGIKKRQDLESRYIVPDAKEFLAKQNDVNVDHQVAPNPQQVTAKKSTKNKDLTKLLKREPVRYFNEVAERSEEDTNSQKKLEGF